MTTATFEVNLTLAGDVARRLREVAQARGMTDEAVVEQALDLLFWSDDIPVLTDYWLSVATMREDWDTMPEDWMADEFKDAVPNVH